MGLGSSFAVLVVAEMLGVKSGSAGILSWASRLGRLCQSLRRAAGDGACLLDTDHSAVPGPRPAAFLAEGMVRW